MFKKAPEVKASANIKSSERRKLLSSICKWYNIPQERLTKDTEYSILPATTKQASFKSPLGFTGIVYFNEEETPIWFKTRDSQLYPSIYTLWSAPFILPTVKTHPHVIKVLAGGADLMLPGTIPPFDFRTTKGSVVGIVDSANPTVIKAVGVCKLNMTQFDYVIGKTGVAVEIMHTINDGLFDLKKFEAEIPKVLNIEFPAPQEADLESVESAVGAQSGADSQEKLDDGESTPETKSQVDTEEIQESVATQEDEDVHSMSDLAERVASLSAEDVDNFFKRALLQSIKLDTIELPISSSNFMANHVLKNLPNVSPDLCNMKKTSWKKSLKFLKAMEKSKYITTKKKGDDVTIEGLMNKTSKEIADFVTHKTITQASAPSNGPIPSKKEKAGQIFQVVNLYKPTNHSRMIFTKVNESYLALYKAPDLRPLLEKYIKLQELIDVKNPKNIVVDDNLKSATKLPLGPAPRDKLFKLFVDNLSPFYVILKPNEKLEDVAENSRFLRGTPPKISIKTEMKIGRKIVTKITHFEQFYIHPLELADELKVKCSGSATIAPCVQNPKLIEVTVQGPHGKLITDLLQDKGIPNTFIEFEDNTKKKKKK